MPNTIAQNKFAVHCGVSRQGVAWAIANKLIAVYKKKINIDHRTTCEYYLKKTGRQLDPVELMKKVKRKSPASRPKKKPVSKPQPITTKPAPVQENPPVPEPEPITAPIDTTPPDTDPEPDDGYTLPNGIENFEDITIHNLHLIPQDLIKKIKEFEVAAKAKQAREISRGELIKRDIVKQVFAQIHTVDTNQWKTLDDKIIPSLCGLFGVQDGSPEAIKARKMVSDEVAKILRYVRRITDEFFEGQEVSQ